MVSVDAQQCVSFHLAELESAEGREVAVERGDRFSYKALRRPVLYCGNLGGSVISVSSGNWSDVGVTGLSLIGLSLIGLSLTGLSLIGLSLTGLSLIGLSLIGLSLTGLSLTDRLQSIGDRTNCTGLTITAGGGGGGTLGGLKMELRGVIAGAWTRARRREKGLDSVSSIGNSSSATAVCETSRRHDGGTLGRASHFLDWSS